MGRDLFPVMVALRQFGERHLFADGEERSRLVERATGKPLHLEVLTDDGRPVSSEAALIVKVSEGGSQFDATMPLNVATRHRTTLHSDTDLRRLVGRPSSTAPRLVG